MKEFKILSDIKKTSVVRLVLKRRLFVSDDEALISNDLNMFDFRYKTIITSNVKYIDSRDNIVLVPEETYNYLLENDIVMLMSEKLIVLWRYTGKDNCFFLTDSCSSCCIMCPQPPKPHRKELEELNYKILDLIPESYKNDICLTGGEPTLYNDYYLTLLSKIRSKFPKNFIITLSNGKSFANLEFLNNYTKLDTKSLVAISFPSDIEKDFNEIMGTQVGFFKTYQGIYNLAKANQPIELRVVISKLNYHRLPYIADYIYRNYPFVVHVAFMGLEFTGYAADNYDKIYINPKDYSNELKEAVLKLYRYGMNVSIYNIPLCLLDDSLHRFAQQSISEWKQEYDPACLQCTKQKICCGVFTTSNEYKYSNIHSFT